MASTPILPPPSQPPYPYTYPEHPLESARRCLIWGWWLIGGGCLFALIPFIGLITWVVGGPLIIAALILAIIAISKGRTGGGVALLLFSIVIAPFAIALGPIVVGLISSTVIGASGAGLDGEQVEIERQLDSETR
jgi:hypothetical protein